MKSGIYVQIISNVILSRLDFDSDMRLFKNFKCFNASQAACVTTLDRIRRVYVSLHCISPNRQGSQSARYCRLRVGPSGRSRL